MLPSIGLSTRLSYSRCTRLFYLRIISSCIWDHELVIDESPRYIALLCCTRLFDLGNAGSVIGLSIDVASTILIITSLGSSGYWHYIVFEYLISVARILMNLIDLVAITRSIIWYTMSLLSIYLGLLLYYCHLPYSTHLLQFTNSILWSLVSYLISDLHLSQFTYLNQTTFSYSYLESYYYRYS